MHQSLLYNLFICPHVWYNQFPFQQSCCHVSNSQANVIYLIKLFRFYLQLFSFLKVKQICYIVNSIVLAHLYLQMFGFGRLFSLKVPPISNLICTTNLVAHSILYCTSNSLLPLHFCLVTLPLHFNSFSTNLSHCFPCTSNLVCTTFFAFQNIVSSNPLPVLTCFARLSSCITSSLYLTSGSAYLQVHIKLTNYPPCNINKSTFNFSANF